MAIKIYNGSSWSAAQALKIYNGSSWVNAVRGWVYNGSSWSQHYPEYPVNTTAPTISYSGGRPDQTWAAAAGKTNTCTQGTWSGSPTSYEYLWQRMPYNGSGGYVSIGVTTSSYTSSASDVGYYLRCRVRATNARGYTDAYASTQVVGPGDLSGLTATQNIQNYSVLSWNASPGATHYYIQYQYVGIIPLTEVYVTGTSYVLDARSYGNAPSSMPLVNPVTSGIPGYPATYLQGYGTNVTIDWPA